VESRSHLDPNLDGACYSMVPGVNPGGELSSIEHEITLFIFRWINWSRNLTSKTHLPLHLFLNYLKVVANVQGIPSDAASLRQANASQARALVFLAHPHRPYRVHHLLTTAIPQGGWKGSLADFRIYEFGKTSSQDCRSGIRFWQFRPFAGKNSKLDLTDYGYFPDSISPTHSKLGNSWNSSIPFGNIRHMDRISSPIPSLLQTVKSYSSKSGWTSSTWNFGIHRASIRV